MCPLPCEQGSLPCLSRLPIVQPEQQWSGQPPELSDPSECVVAQASVSELVPSTASVPHASSAVLRSVSRGYQAVPVPVETGQDNLLDIARRLQVGVQARDTPRHPYYRCTEVGWLDEAEAQNMARQAHRIGMLAWQGQGSLPAAVPGAGTSLYDVAPDGPPRDSDCAPRVGGRSPPGLPLSGGRRRKPIVSLVRRQGKKGDSHILPTRGSGKRQGVVPAVAGEESGERRAR